MRLGEKGFLDATLTGLTVFLVTEGRPDCVGSNPGLNHPTPLALGAQMGLWIDTIFFRFMDDSKSSVPGSAEPQLRHDCLSFWSVKAELGLRGPGREGPLYFKISYKRAVRVGSASGTAAHAPSTA